MEVIFFDREKGFTIVKVERENEVHTYTGL